jgi:hypothetical protein
MQHLQEKGGGARQFNRLRGCHRLDWRLSHIRQTNLSSSVRRKLETDRTAQGLSSELGLCYPKHDLNLASQEPLTMEWTTPQHEEIDLNCEISSYANAEL